VPGAWCGLATTSEGRTAEGEGTATMSPAPTFTINPDTGQGLLKLPSPWTPLEYQAAATEMAAEGWEIAPHDHFHAHLDRATYYLLRPAC
jgi:hypothetical protein